MGKLPEYTNWLKNLSRKSVWGLMDFTFSLEGLLKGERLFNEMKSFIPDISIEEMEIPFAAIATDILNEKEIVFKTGSYYEAIRASMAIPTLFTPVKYKDTILVDGGVINPIPIEHVSRSKDDFLIVVSLYGKKSGQVIKKSITKDKDSRAFKFNSYINNLTGLMSTGDRRSFGYYSLLNATTSTMVHQLAKNNIERHKPDLLISIPADSASTFDFHRAEELIALGAKTTIEQLEKYDN